MKISKVEVWKFRSIEKASVNIGEVTALVGENNVGKSNLLRALNAFFNFDEELECFKNRNHMYSPNSQSRIKVTFTDIHNEIGEEYLNGGELKLGLTYRLGRNKPTYTVYLHGEDKNISHEVFAELISNFKFIYIKLARDSKSSFAKENGEAYNLLSMLLEMQVSKRNTIDPIIRELYNKFKNTILKDSKRLIEDSFPKFDKNIDFSLFVDEDNLADYIIRNVALNVKEGNVVNSVNDCGSGLQNAVYLAIKYSALKHAAKPVLIAVEEPEQNLHPQAQRRIVMDFFNRRKYKNAQFILTSHSTTIIDSIGHESVVLCRKSASQTRNVVTTFSQIDDTFLLAHNIDREAYNDYYEYQNSDFFFSRYVVVVEGAGDKAVYRRLLKKYLKPEVYDDITFVTLNGERNIKFVYYLLKELKIPFFCVLDRDVFQMYAHDNRKDSIDENGRLLYKTELKSSSQSRHLIEDEDDMSKLPRLLNEGPYSKLCGMLAKYNLLSLKYTLEVDLIVEGDGSVLNFLYEELEVPQHLRTPKHLLIDKRVAIKNKGLLVKAVEKAKYNQLPFSYKKIVALAKNTFVN